MLKPGTRAPEFVLPDQDGRDVSLDELLGKGPLILYFYPADFTSGCTREACTIRDSYSDLAAVGLQVAGVSPQPPDSHHRFRRQNRLPFTLLADVDKSVIRQYDVDGPLGVGVRRATYLINPDRGIQDAVLADVRIARHKAFIDKAVALREAAGLRAGKYSES